MLVKSSMLSQFTNDHQQQQQQQQQTPTSPSLQRNSSRIQTKSTAFNNNANYDGIEQDSPISNESQDRNSKHFWPHLSKIYKPNTLPTSKFKASSITIADQQDITNMLYSYYKELANSPNIDENEQHDQTIVDKYNKIMNTLSQPLDIKVEKVTSSEITKIIKKLKNEKSLGYDQISNYIIKLLPPAYIDCLVRCFNVWLSEGRYPDFWKLAKIVTLNKLNAGVPRSDQTRPISLLATHSKVFEKVLLERVSNWTEGAQLVPIEQSDFRQGGLIATRVLSICQEIQNNLAANMPTLVLYVDYRKAHDMVWHAVLLVKLHNLGMPIALLRMTASWLGHRQAYISFGGKVSEKHKINIGLPQGSSLSPFLFIVYHCDLIQYLGAHSGHLFADDLSVLITAPITKSLATVKSDLEKEGTEDLCGRAKCH
ncbi:unnamed protein product [Rotaria socialis]|uniref:Reverse transcriptase domain-containing protein n=2 Tax=Rotaria socialis TaxID=392032 RepID=A0A817T098_9BILA|nr:unnamed protein product [Rotaria socialis]